MIVHIAGVHAIGSLGAAHFLTTSAAELFERVGDRSFSLVVQADYPGLEISASQLVTGPYVW